MSRLLATASPLGELPEGWAVARLKDITTKVGSGATPKGGESNYLRVRDRFALIRSQNVFDRYFDADGLAYITDRQAGELRTAEVRRGDVLLNITGDGITFSRACAVPEHVLPACVNQHVSIIRPDAKRCTSEYLLCYLTHPGIKDYIGSFNSGGSRRAITKGHIESFEVPLPPLNLQQAIGSVLGALDDKIALNRRTNETLECIARAIFKSWFVDFDSVRAKAEGRQPAGMDAETAALFPARFTEWRNRYLPYGWRLGCVSELGDVICGKTPATANKANYGAEIPFITIPDMHGKVFVLSAARSLSTQGAVSQANKTVPPRSVCVSCIATPGLVAMTTEASQTNQQINTVIPRDDQAAFYAFFCLRDLGDDIRARGSGGSVYHNLNKGQFSALEIALPSDEVVSRFGQAVAPAFDLLLLNDRQTLTLMALRDTLLPKLLSGEFRIRDAEKMVEANV